LSVIRVLQVASEATPFAKTGGLADVVGALPEAIVHQGCDVALKDRSANGTSASVGLAGRIMRSSRRAGRAGCGPIVEVPRSFLSTLKAGFFSSAQTGLETALLAGRPHRGMGSRQRLWMSITGSSSGDA
jgi:hypothetical protein